MQYEKSVLLKNNKECCIRNAVGDDAQEVLDIFLLTHEQTDFLASYRDEATFDTAFERQFLADRERADRDVYLCAVVDGHIVGTAGVGSMGSNKIRHRAELGVAVDKDFCGIGNRPRVDRSLHRLCKKSRLFSIGIGGCKRKTAMQLLCIKVWDSWKFGRNPRGFCSRYQGWQELISMRLELD